MERIDLFSFGNCFLGALNGSVNLSVSFPNSEGTKSLTPAALALTARASWTPTARRLIVEMRTSIPDNADLSEEGEV